MPSPALQSRRIPRLLISLLLLAGAGPLGQPFRLPTTFSGATGSQGSMFDLAVAGPNPVVIRNFEQNFLGNGGAAWFQIWTTTAGGPFLPQASNPTAWTLLASGPVGTLPAGTPTVLPFTLDLTLQPGAVRGFYLTCTNVVPSGVAYTTGAPGTQGLPYVSDGRLEVRVGVGRIWPFGFTFGTRTWNGAVNYCLAGPCLPEWETNDSHAAMDVDGVLATSFQPAAVERCPGQAFTLASGTVNAGLPWEAVLAVAPGVSAMSGGQVTAGGQILNVPFGTVPNFFFNGGTIPLFLPYSAPFAIPFQTPAIPGTLSCQQVNAAPGHPDGFALSQACELRVTGTPSIPGPTGDDTSVLVVPGAAPLCGPATIPFYGTARTSFHVISNGRIVFGPADLDFTPTIPDALAGPPFAGAWCDLSPVLGGAIAVTRTGPQSIRIAWTAVPYFGNPALAPSFSLVLDAATGSMTFDGLHTFPPFPPTAGTSDRLFLGISPGAPAAFDAGPAAFLPGTSGAAAAGPSLLYAFGQAGTLAPGVSTLVLTPSTTTHLWSAF